GLSRRQRIIACPRRWVARVERKVKYAARSGRHPVGIQVTRERIPVAARSVWQLAVEPRLDVLDVRRVAAGGDPAELVKSFRSLMADDRDQRPGGCRALCAKTRIARSGCQRIR